MKAIDQPFGNIINGSKQFIIPVFQRDYRWEEEQCKQLWLDVIRAARSKGSHRHFLGSIVYVSTGDTFASFTRWLLIDGQQRLTTLTLLLAALRDHIKEAKWAGREDDENAPTVQQIDAYFLQNVQESGTRRPKLMLRRQDHETLQAIITGTPRPAETSSRITETYELFRDLVASEDPSLIYAGIGNLVLVDVSLDRKTDDPQLVFESLNSTGIDLSQSDLIRNFILMQLTEQDQTRLCTAYWSQIETLFRGAEQVFDAFARDYIALKTRATKQTRADSVYFAFRNAWDTLRGKDGSVDDVLTDMLRHARAFAAFSLGRFDKGPVLDALTNLRRLLDAPAMLVMRLLDCHSQNGAFTASQMVEAIRILEAYVLRRAICREQTRGYWQVFANLAYDIDQANPLDSLKVGLVRLQGTYRAMPAKEFEHALEADDIYNLRVCKFLLDRLENYGSKEPTALETLSIEHIMPQTLEQPWVKMLGEKAEAVHAAWLHRLGNLTLTGYNSEYSKHAFEKKKTMAGGFAQSAVRLNQYVRDQSVWTETQMAERGKLLAAKAIEIWPALAVSPALLKAAQERDKRQQAADSADAVLKVSPKAAPLFAALKEAMAKLGSVIEIVHGTSISYHAPDFFLEVLPRRNRLTLILPLEFSELPSPPSFAGDRSEWKFIVNAQHSGGVLLSVTSLEEVRAALPIIQQALNSVRGDGG